MTKKTIYVCIQYYMVIVLYEIYKAKKAKERHISGKRNKEEKRGKKGTQKDLVHETDSLKRITITCSLDLPQCMQF